MSNLPSIRWGIITTGMIAEWTVCDLLLDRPDAKVKNIIQAIRTSSIEKGEAFAKEFCPNEKPVIYGSYKEAYANPDVDLVYIGTPHGFHGKDCLAAISYGKNILCEKAFTLNAREAKEVFDAAKARGVYIAEAMWLRHRPLTRDLLRLIHEEKVLGEIIQAHSAFEQDLDVPNLPPTSRYRQPSLGPGSFLDLGVYALTWVLMALETGDPATTPKPKILASQVHWEDIEVSTTAILAYPNGKQGLVRSGTNIAGNPDLLARIIGTEGTIEVQGPCSSAPIGFTVYPKFIASKGCATNTRGPGKEYRYPVQGRGYQYQLENVALDVLAGRKESKIVPWSLTLRVIEIMDEVRRQGGTVYECDKQ